MAATPSSLQGLAAEKYLEIITRCHFIRKLNTYTWKAKMMSKPKDKREQIEEMVMHLEIEKPNALRNDLMALMQYLSKELGSLPKVQQVLKNYMVIRSELPTAAGCEAVIQLLFSTNEFLMQCSQQCFVMFLALIGQRFDNIKSFLSYEFSINDHLLEMCLPMFPKLSVLKIRLETANAPRSLEIIRRLAPCLEELCLPQLPISYLNDDVLSQFFFAGNTFKRVEKKFVEGARVQLSFQKLKRLTINFVLPSCIRIFRMLLFCYEGCSIDWIPELEDPVKVSVFDAALCPAIAMFPNLALDLCELRFEDLRFPYVEEVCTSWSNLRTLRLMLGQSFVQVDSNLAQKKLAAILANCANLNRFQLVLLENNVEKGYEIILNAFKKCGRKIRDFTLNDVCQTLSHKDIIDLLNRIPNVRTLCLKCKPTSRYYKEAKLNPLLQLTKFRFGFMYEHTMVKGKLSSLLVSDIIKESPNLTHLTVPAGENFISVFCKLKINPKVETMNFIIYSHVYERGEIERIVNFLKRTSVKEMSVHLSYEGSLTMSDYRHAYGDDVYPQPIIYGICYGLELNVRYFSEDFSVEL